MIFSEWRKKHRLTQVEAGDIAGISANAIAMAERAGRDPSFNGKKVVSILEGEIPNFEFSTEGGSYNQPIVVINSITYGPGDVIRGDGRICAHVILLWACAFERTEEEYQTARKFLRYWVNGPQLR